MSDLLRQWVSYRGQTLSRTGMGDYLIINLLNSSITYRSEVKTSLIYLSVRGMMYYRKALELQCFLELAGDKGSLVSVTNAILLFFWFEDKCNLSIPDDKIHILGQILLLPKC